MKMNYDNTRYYLFTQSYVAFRLVSALREKYKIPPGMSPADWQKRLLSEQSQLFEKKQKEWEQILKRKVSRDAGSVWLLTDLVEKDVTPEITTVARHLNINEDIFRIFVFYNNVPDKIFPPERVFHANPLRPITESGIYIRIDGNLRKRELLTYFREAKAGLRLFQKENNDTIKKKKRKQVAHEDEDKGRTYCFVEDYIKQNAEKKEQIKYEQEEFFKNELISVAIENAAGELADRSGKDEKEADKLFEEWKITIQTFYYEITKRYNLPTVRDLPAILRLVNP